MSDLVDTFGLGWLRDRPDLRDYTAETISIKELLNGTGVPKLSAAPAALPPTVDLRPWCAPIENQGALGSCTANAGVGILEYFERRAFNKYIDASRLFLYKVTRDLMGWTGDTGAFLRNTMGAMVLFGVPPEKYLPYNLPDFDKEPSAFCYAFAGNYKAIQYYRLDPAGTTPAAVLAAIKTNLASNLPSMFGFTVYSSIAQAGTTGKIPMPAPGESVVGGHAIVAVGYDDAVLIQNTAAGAVATKGALIIRNSWGTGWGDHGYGYMPYEFVLKSIAVDWWTLIKADWVNTGVFVP